MERVSAPVAAAVVVRQQLALALNRRAEMTLRPAAARRDRKRAVRIVDTLLKERGASAETYGILGRIHKGLFQAARGKGEEATSHLDKAIAAYTAGFESEPADYYPGVNAITLLVQRGTKEALAEVDRLIPLVTFAVARRGESEDYWDRATVLELALIGRDDDGAKQALPPVLASAAAAWMAETTRKNLEMLVHSRARKRSDKTMTLKACIAALKKKEAELK